MKSRIEILNKVASGELTPIEAEKQLLVLTDVIPRSAEFWSGFDYACIWLDELFAKSHPHKYNIADCLKAKVNKLPKSKIRLNAAHGKDKILTEIENSPSGVYQKFMSAEEVKFCNKLVKEGMLYKAKPDEKNATIAFFITTEGSKWLENQK